MLDYVPIIQQCDSLCGSGGSEEIHQVWSHGLHLRPLLGGIFINCYPQALVKVYLAMIEFYLSTSQSLRSSTRATVEQLSGDLLKATDRFNKNGRLLADTVHIATHKKLQQIENLLKDHHVGSLLDHAKFKAMEMYHFEMQELRADEACQWLLTDDTFRTWVAADTSQFLTFFGDMGCGKTVTTSCVIDYLQGIFPRTLVLYVYSRTQASTNTLESIYNSLLVQLVERDRRLKLVFKDLYDEEKRVSLQVDPTSRQGGSQVLSSAALYYSRRPR